MRPSGLIKVEGTPPGPDQLAALGAAVAALLEDERAAAADPLPAAYSSRWRRSGIADAVRPFTARSGA
jgi:hypothetical protein